MALASLHYLANSRVNKNHSICTTFKVLLPSSPPGLSKFQLFLRYHNQCPSVQHVSLTSSPFLLVDTPQRVPLSPANTLQFNLVLSSILQRPHPLALMLLRAFLQSRLSPRLCSLESHLSSYIRGGKRVAVAGSETATTLTSSLHFHFKRWWRIEGRIGTGKTLCDKSKDKTTGKNIYTKLYDLLLVHVLGFFTRLLLIFSTTSQV